MKHGMLIDQDLYFEPAQVKQRLLDFWEELNRGSRGGRGGAGTENSQTVLWYRFTVLPLLRTCLLDMLFFTRFIENLLMRYLCHGYRSWSSDIKAGRRQFSEVLCRGFKSALLHFQRHSTRCFIFRSSNGTRRPFPLYRWCTEYQYIFKR